MGEAKRKKEQVQREVAKREVAETGKMSILTKLTLANLQQNRRRTLFTMIGVALSSALMLSVVGMVTSLRQTMIDAAIAQTGDYHEMYENVPEAGRQYIEHNAKVASYYYAGAVEVTDAEMREFYEVNQHTPYNARYVGEDTAPDYSRIYVRYRNVREYEDAREWMLSVVEENTGVRPNYRTNRQLIQYEGGLGEEALTELTMVAGIVIAIIVVTSVFSIRNSFSISATERMRQFGMLASVGATKRQIRWSVLLEGLMVWVIAMPLGLLLGLVATGVLVLIVTALIGDGLNAAMAFAVPWWILPVIAGLSLVTVLLSALFPATRAARRSPIEAMRGNREVKLKPRKVRVSPLTRKVFGVGGVLASKNLKRSRRKYRTTVVSIVLSVATFVGLTTFMDQAFSSVGLMYRQVEYDLMVATEYPETIKEIAEQFELKEMAYYQSVQMYAPEMGMRIVSVNDEYFANYAKKIGVSGKLDTVAILYDYIFVRGGGKSVLRHALDVQAGDELTLMTHGGDGREVAAKITHVAEEAPLGLEMSIVPVLIVSESYAVAQDWPVQEDGVIDMLAATDEPGEIMAFIEQNAKNDKRYKEMYAQNVREAMRMMNNLYLLIAIFLYGFIAVITLIGVTNVFNTISANVILRAGEFAALKSVGMTSREFNRMVRLESLMYSVKALVIGVPLGLLISYGFYTAMSGTYDFGYSVPWMAIGLAVIGVGLLVSVVMRYSVRLTARQNIIETIRSDNV